MPSLSEQVRALANGSGHALAVTHFHEIRPSRTQIASMFTLSETDISAVLANCDFWLEFVKQEPGRFDGFYLVADGNGFRTYEQERGVAFQPERWHTFEQARSAYARILVRKLHWIRGTSATGVRGSSSNGGSPLPAVVAGLLGAVPAAIGTAGIYLVAVLDVPIRIAAANALEVATMTLSAGCTIGIIAGLTLWFLFKASAAFRYSLAVLVVALSGAGFGLYAARGSPHVSSLFAAASGVLAWTMVGAFMMTSWRLAKVIGRPDKSESA